MSSLSSPRLVKNWKVLYPIALDKSRSVSEGRLVSAAESLTNPTMQEIIQACEALKIPIVAEKTKRHPSVACDPEFAGRVRYQLTTFEGSPIVANCTTKTAFARLLARQIKTTPSRAAQAKHDAEVAASKAKDAAKKAKRRH